MIDTHAHISKEYYDDISKIIASAKETGLEKIIISGCEKKSILETLDLLNIYDILYGTIGYHPDEADIITDEDILQLENNIVSNDKIVGIGEIGLDYHYDNIDKNKQKELFEKQLILAEKLNLPVVIHSRDATKDTYDILDKYNVKGIMHCFSGSLEVANMYIKKGFYLGIGGVLTFKNCNLKDVLKNISLNNIVLETDCPYLAPVPFRGKINEPSYVIEIAKFLAEIKNVDLKELDRITTENVNGLFDLNN